MFARSFVSAGALRRIPKPAFYALLVSLSLVSFQAIVWFVVRPLHRAGIAQEILWPFNTIGHLIDVPSLLILRIFLGEYHLGNSPGGPFVLLPVSLIFFWCVCMASWAARNRLRAIDVEEQATEPEDKTAAVAEEIVAAPALSRRSFLGVITSGTVGLAASGGAASLLAYSVFFEPHRVPITRNTIAIKDLPRSLSGLRVVQLTDLHLGPWISQQFVRSIIDRTNALKPDLVVLTGDYIHQSADYIQPVTWELGRLQARIGVAGVLGNHDWWESHRLSVENFERAGIPLIDNTRLFVSPDGKLERSAHEGLCIAGVGDLWEDEINISDALGGVPDNMPRLVLSHNPDVVEESEIATGQYRVDLMFSGHTHGGQVGFPSIGTPIVPSKFGGKYSHGLIQGPACPIYVSRGIGMTGLPVRFCVPPEIAVVELVSA